MSSKPGTTDASGAEPSSTTGESTASVDEPTGSAVEGLVGAWLAVPAVIWLALALRSVLVSLRTDSVLGAVEAAIGLPALISAALVGGAAVGLAAARFLAPRLHRGSATRFAVALGAGLLTGVASAATVVVGYDAGESTVMVLGAVVAAGATIGGGLAGVRASAVVAAGVAGSLVVFLLTFGRGLFDSELLALFGADTSPISRVDAQQRLVWVGSAVDGLLAGVVAFLFLRRAGRRSVTPPRWPAYLAAGGGAGAALLLTEVITQVGGARLLDLARSISEIDDLVQDLATQARLNSALIVLFLGALTAMILFGRTLGPAAADPDEED